MSEITDKRIENETEEFLWAIAPFGGGDIKAMIRTAIDGGHNGGWAAEQIEQFMEDTNTKLSDIDPNYVVYDALFQEARNDINDLTGKDILNDTEHQIEVYGNCMCTSLDYSEEAKEELLEILKEISLEDETNAITWLINEIDIKAELTEKRTECPDTEEEG